MTARRLHPPTGTTYWRCVAPDGTHSIHTTEQAAADEAARQDKATWHPIVVEDLEETA